jgi:hypothetical protein
MESNMYSTGTPDGLTKLAALEAAVDRVIAEDLSGLSEAARADRARELRRVFDLLEDLWLRHLAAVDRRGAAGADRGEVASSTADWLCDRLGVSSATANSWVRIARARYPGP